MSPSEINITWSVDDVLGIRPDLTDDQAMEVLENVADNHDAEYGVCWDTLVFWAHSLFPKKDTQSYTIEITETLQSRITVEAISAEAALLMVQDAYRAEEYVLDSGHFMGVDFEVIENEISPWETGEADG